MNKQIPLFIVALVIVSGGSFFGGMEFQKTQKVSNAGGQNFGNFQRQGGTGMTGGQNSIKRTVTGGFSNGTILSKDDKSITIKLRNGGSQIVFVSDSTSVLKSEKGTKEDLSVDQNITVTGKSNSDGSFAAESIQIRPEGEILPGMMGGYGYGKDIPVGR